MTIVYSNMIYTKEVYTFEMAKDSIDIDENGHCTTNMRFLRSKEGETIYRKHISDTIEIYGSMHAYIKKHIFNNVVDYVISDNGYPYNFESNCCHKILWSRSPLDPNKIIGILKKHEYDDFVWFENKTEHKSIPEIVHYHVICKKN